MSIEGGAHDSGCCFTTDTPAHRHHARCQHRDVDRSRLQTFIHTSHASARARTRAEILLKLGGRWSPVEVCRAFDVCRNTVVRVRTRFAEGGVDAALSEKRQTRYRAALNGTQQAHLIAVACSPIPDGHDHWTLRMLAGKAVELGFVESISPETIRALLKERAEALAAPSVVHPQDER